MITLKKHEFATIAKANNARPVIQLTPAGFVITMVDSDNNSFVLLTSRGDIRYFKTFESMYKTISFLFPEAKEFFVNDLINYFKD